MTVTVAKSSTPRKLAFNCVEPIALAWKCPGWSGVATSTFSSWLSRVAGACVARPIGALGGHGHQRRRFAHLERHFRRVDGQFVGVAHVHRHAGRKALKLRVGGRHRQLALALGKAANGLALDLDHRLPLRGRHLVLDGDGRLAAARVEAHTTQLACFAYP